MSRSKDLNKLHSRLRRQGFTVTLTAAGHYKYQAPNGKISFGSSTPSDHRSIDNLRSRLVKLGYKEG